MSTAREQAVRRLQLCELILEYARWKFETHNERSLRSWVISAVAAAGGTLLAVSQLRRATGWGELVRILEVARADALRELSA